MCTFFTIMEHCDIRESEYNIIYKCRYYAQMYERFELHS